MLARRAVILWCYSAMRGEQLRGRDSPMGMAVARWKTAARAAKYQARRSNVRKRMIRRDLLLLQVG